MDWENNRWFRFLVVAGYKIAYFCGYMHGMLILTARKIQEFINRIGDK